MSYTIAIAGKGGTGKTTIAALLVRLLKENKKGSILAVDADPNSNLAESLGVETGRTIGDILDLIARQPQKVPAGMPKERFIEYEVQGAVVEAEGFDLLTMGAPEGPGCYCYVNNALRNVLGALIKDYDFIVIDNEAGLEHFSRRTTRQADALIIVSDGSRVGLKSAARINALVKELKIPIKKSGLLINRYDGDIEQKKIDDMGLIYSGRIPFDETIAQISANGNSVWQLDKNAASLTTLSRLGEKIWL